MLGLGESAEVSFFVIARLDLVKSWRALRSQLAHTCKSKTFSSLCDSAVFMDCFVSPADFLAMTVLFSLDSAESLESLYNSALDSVCDSADSAFLRFALLDFLDL